MTAATPTRRHLTDADAMRSVSAGELPALTEEIREFLIQKMRATGGHLGPNLGVAELAPALHRVFDSPHDALIFDTGHQAYVHKPFTDRAKKFDGLLTGRRPVSRDQFMYRIQGRTRHVIGFSFRLCSCLWRIRRYRLCDCSPTHQSGRECGIHLPVEPGRGPPTKTGD